MLINHNQGHIITVAVRRLKTAGVEEAVWRMTFDFSIREIFLSVALDLPPVQSQQLIEENVCACVIFVILHQVSGVVAVLFLFVIVVVIAAGLQRLWCLVVHI